MSSSITRLSFFQRVESLFARPLASPRRAAEVTVNGMDHVMEWDGMGCHGMEWNGMEWNGMECAWSPQVTINVGEGDKVPSCPMPGHAWGVVQHDNTVTWLAQWNENVQNQNKYVMLAASSSLKGISDRKKYEKAMQLKVIDRSRASRESPPRASRLSLTNTVVRAASRRGAARPASRDIVVVVASARSLARARITSSCVCSPRSRRRASERRRRPGR